MHTRQCEVLLHQSHIQTLKQHCLLFVTVIRRQQVRCFDSIVYVVTPLTNTYKAWLRDKVDSTPFALPGLYQPVSLIPLTIWKACPWWRCIYLPLFGSNRDILLLLQTPPRFPGLPASCTPSSSASSGMQLPFDFFPSRWMRVRLSTVHCLREKRQERKSCFPRVISCR